MDSQRSNSIVGKADEGRKKHKQNKRGMTQKQLAEMSGVPLSTVRHIENGAHVATFKDVVKLARALHTSRSACDRSTSSSTPLAAQTPAGRIDHQRGGNQS